MERGTGGEAQTSGDHKEAVNAFFDKHGAFLNGRRRPRQAVVNLLLQIPPKDRPNRPIF
jgi:hypothetical protein